MALVVEVAVVMGERCGADAGELGGDLVEAAGLQTARLEPKTSEGSYETVGEGLRRKTREREESYS